MNHRLSFHAICASTGNDNVVDPNVSMSISVGPFIGEWVDAFRAFLIASGFSPELVEDFVRPANYSDVSLDEPEDRQSGSEPQDQPEAATSA